MNHIKNGCEPMFPVKMVCSRQDNRDLCCLYADGSNNFLNSGIAEGSLIYVDRNLPFEKGSLNIFRVNGTYILSELNISNGKFIGRAIMSVNRYI